MSQPVYSSESPAALTPAKRAAAVAAARGPRKVAAAPKPVRPAPAEDAPLPHFTHTVLTDPRLPGIEITLELISPETAGHYLAKLPTSQSKIKQRALSPKTVSRYSGDMASAQWPFTGDPIRFNNRGELVDGQHRLQAIIDSNITQPMMVIRGLEPETFAVFDTGRARSFTDVLKSMGIPNTSMVAGVTRRVFYWQRGGYAVQGVARTPNSPLLSIPASPGMLLETFEKYRPEIQAAARRGAGVKASGFATKTAAPGAVGFLYFLFRRINKDACEKFFHELRVGPAQIGPEYPIAVLRKRLYQQVSSAEKASADWVWVHFFIHTWNKWLAGESMGALKTPPYPTVGYLAKPRDPDAATRDNGWEPIPLLTLANVDGVFA